MEKLEALRGNCVGDISGLAGNAENLDYLVGLRECIDRMGIPIRQGYIVSSPEHLPQGLIDSYRELADCLKRDECGSEIEMMLSTSDAQLACLASDAPVFRDGELQRFVFRQKRR